MTKGQTFIHKGKLWNFDSTIQYKNSGRVLVAARRWIKSTQKWSSSILMVCTLEEAEAGIKKEE